MKSLARGLAAAAAAVATRKIWTIKGYRPEIERRRENETGHTGTDPGRGRRSVAT
jgi:negative regulator of sigma E activity